MFLYNGSIYISKGVFHMGEHKHKENLTKKQNNHEEAKTLEKLENKNFRRLLAIDLTGLVLFAFVFGYINSTFAADPNIFSYNFWSILIYGGAWYYFIDRKIDGVLYQGLLLLLAVLIIKAMGIGK